MADADASEGRCSAAERCTGGSLVRNQDGTFTHEPAVTPRPFCESCTGRIAAALDELPGAYRHLGAEIGERPVTGKLARVPAGPRIPLREDVDALMRLMAVTLCSWEARARAQAGWTPRSNDHPVDSYEAVAEAARVLRELPTVFHALAPKWMSHTLPLPPAKASTRGRPYGVIPAELEDLYGEREMVRRGEDFLTVQLRLGTADAGNAILKLRARCLRQLGEIRAQPETLDGVPCRRCEDMALERAEPPSDPSQPAMYSRCASCRDQMGHADYLGWAAMYAAWADDLGLVCRRCAATPPRCAECRYARCACAASGHAVAA